jgi:hypothetical protein
MDSDKRIWRMKVKKPTFNHRIDYNTAIVRNDDTLTLNFVEGGRGDVLSFTKDVQLLLVLCRLLLLSQNTLSEF